MFHFSTDDIETMFNKKGVWEMFKSTSDIDSEQLNKFIDTTAHTEFSRFVDEYFKVISNEHNKVMSTLGIMPNPPGFNFDRRINSGAKPKFPESDKELNSLLDEAKVMQRGLYLKYFEIYEVLKKKISKNKLDIYQDIQTSVKPINTSNSDQSCSWMNMPKRTLEAKPYSPLSYTDYKLDVDTLYNVVVIIAGLPDPITILVYNLCTNESQAIDIIKYMYSLAKINQDIPALDVLGKLLHTS